MFEFFGIPDEMGFFLLIAIPAIPLYFIHKAHRAKEDARNDANLVRK